MKCRLRGSGSSTVCFETTRVNRWRRVSPCIVLSTPIPGNQPVRHRNSSKCLMLPSRKTSRKGRLMVKQELLDILCCPKCKGDLAYKPKIGTLTCKKCGKVYRVKDDIPIM